MKPRMLILVAVLLFSLSLVGLGLNAFVNFHPMQALDQNSKPSTVAEDDLISPKVAVGQTSSSLQPMSNLVDEDDEILAARSLSLGSYTDRGQFTPPTWFPPSENQTVFNPQAARAEQYDYPAFVFQGSNPARQMGDYASPAGQVGYSADTDSQVLSPVGGLLETDQAAGHVQIMPESIQNPPTGINVDLAYNVLFGYLSPGDLVTATITSGTAYGTAYADGVGYFFTTLWETNGQPVDLVGGETIEVYVNGSLSESITLPTVSAAFDLESDQVVGTSSGLAQGSTVNVALGIWGWEPTTDTPAVATSTNSTGEFTATFTADIGPHDYARLETTAGSGYVYYYAYPHNAFEVDTFNYVFGYAKPLQPLTVTVYISPTNAVRGTQTVTPNWPHGDYSTELLVVPGDTVEVDEGGGITYTLQTSNLTALPDLLSDQVTGQAPISSTVRIFIYNLLLGEYTETVTTADENGNYTANFPTYDLTSRDAIFPAYIGEGGSEVLLSVFPPAIQVFPDTDQVIGRGDGAGIPYTYTLNHLGQDYVISGTTDFLNSTGWADFSALGVDLLPGDQVALETKTWSGSMVVADIILEVDTDNNRYWGSVDQSGELAIVSFPWPMWMYPVYKLDSGTTQSLTNYEISLPGQDIRAGTLGRVLHYDTNFFITRKDFEVRYFELELPWGLNSPQYNEAEVITGTLYNSDHLTIKKQVSRDDDGNSQNYWLDFGGELAAGDWISVTNGSDWSAWMQVPELTLSADRETDLVSGSAPQTLLYIEGGTDLTWFGAWLPSYKEGEGYSYLLDASAFGTDMDYGSWVNVYSQADNGNRARRSFAYPNLVAAHNPDGSTSMYGNNLMPGDTVFITVTHPISGVVAHGSAPVGSGYSGPTGFDIYFPEYSLTPGDLIYVDFGSGLTDTLTVVHLTGQVDMDTDLVTGEAPADALLSASVWDVSGNNIRIDQIQVSASGTYTVDFGAVDWDINNGDYIAIDYPAGHGHQFEVGISLPSPDLNLQPYNTNGEAQPGGPYAYGVWLSNDGSLEAEDVQVRLTLPPSTTWSGDTTGVVPEIGGNGVITWSLGTLVAQAQRNFFITVLLDPDHPTGDGALGQLCAEVTTSTSGDGNPGNNSSCSGKANVHAEDIDIRVDKWPNPGDVVAGQEFVYDIQVCNQRSTAAGPVWLTDTLPSSTGLVSLTPRNWWGEKYWSEETYADGVLELYFPAIPGNTCTDMELRLLAEDGLPFNYPLPNLVEVYTADDMDPASDQRLNEDARIGSPRPELGMEKYFEAGILVPGGELSYKLNYYNSGNITLAGRITDTLPAGTSYVDGSSYDNNQPITPALVTADQVVWDLGAIGVYRGSGLTYRLAISGSTLPGTELVNCAEIGSSAVDGTPDDNSACDKRTVQGHGPNLQVEKQSWWNGDAWQHYEITFRNLGDQDIYAPLVTDTYPVSTTFTGNWNYNYWNNINLLGEQSNRRLVWQIDQLPSGNAGSIGLDLPVDVPGQRMRWYTNTVEIDTPIGETNPGDNVYTNTLFSGAEVDRFELWVGSDHVDVWGSAQPGYDVYILNHGITYTTFAEEGCGGCYDLPDIGAIWPGDRITVTAGLGLQPVVIQVPATFDVQADSRTDQVTGQISVDEGSWLRAELYGYYGQDVQVGASGNYTATFTDIPRGGEGHVRYETTIDFTQAVFHRRFRSPDLIMDVNYAHDWVNGRYEIGHTVWITVTESDGVTPKATAEVETYPVPWWNGEIGFEPQDDEWSPSRPDLQEGDWVYGAVDTGFTTTVHIGSITGLVDPALDQITGTILAAWIDQLVELRCHTWGDPSQTAPQKLDFILPDGEDVYSCAWNPLTEWDVQPGQEIGVQYYEPDGDSVFGAFHAPSANLRVEYGPQGNSGEGGNLQLQMQYANQGELASDNVVITQTLHGMQYLDDDSTFPILTGTNPGGDPYVVYQLGTLDPGDWVQFETFARVTAPASTTITSTAQISGMNDGGNPQDKIRSWFDHVRENDTHINLGKSAWTGDPAAGRTVIWSVNVCTNGSTSASTILLTDTLPDYMTLLDWWAQHSGWSEVSRDATELVVTRPTLSSGWCSQVMLRFQVDADVPVGTNIQNTAEVWAANDIETDDNQSTNWVSINNPHTNINVGQWWGGGSLVPGGSFRFHMSYSNNGNVPVAGVWITDTLPVSTTLDHIYLYDRFWNFIREITPIVLPGNQVKWEIGDIEPGQSDNMEVMVTADPNASPGISIVNTVEISRLPGEDSFADNIATWTETLFGHGPNLRLRQQYGWNGNNQLRYQIDFSNVGDEVVSTTWITDHLPDNTTWDGSWNMGFDWGRLISQTLTAHQLRWQFSEIYPGDNGWLQFNANLDDPNVRPRWYTNTSTASLDPADTNPADNIAITTVVLGEVENVSLWVNPGSYGIWGNAQLGALVTVTTATGQYTTTASLDPGCNGCWGIPSPPQLLPGETITVTAGAGSLPVVIPIPEPISVQADSSTDTVWGQFGTLEGQSLWLDLNGYPGVGTQTDVGGTFTASFPDIPLAGVGHVRYDTTINYTSVNIYYRYQASDLLLRVNYTHDWAQAIYPAGHTVWITVTNSTGEQKATYEGFTTVNAAWSSDGFETQGGQWTSEQPAIEAGDWVYAEVDTGDTTAVHIGAITGVVNIDTDQITGTVSAPWIAEEVDLICHANGGPPGAPQKQDSVLPDGVDEYSCAWNPLTEWDVQVWQDIGVEYYEPDGDSVVGVFHAAYPNLQVQINPYGNASEAGNVQLQVQYVNAGDLNSNNVVITQTLEGMQYLGNTSGFATITGTTPGGDPYVVYQLGALSPGGWQQFDMFAGVTVPASQTITSTVHIAGTPDGGNPGDKERTWTGHVQGNDTHINLGKGPWTGDPLAGGQIVWTINVCNYGSTSSSAIVLTDTLPAHMSLVDWDAQHEGWTLVSWDTSKLVVTRPSLPNGWCSQVLLRFQVDVDVMVGTSIENIADVWSDSDIETNDNHVTNSVSIGNPRTNLSLSQWWAGGSLVPGGSFRLHMGFSNNGNQPVNGVYITDTLPANATLEYIHRFDQYWNNIGEVTPVSIIGNQVVWEVGSLENGESGQFEVSVRIDPGATPGLSLENTVDITRLPGEDTYTDNTSTWTDTLFDNGPNLRLTKRNWWNDDSQLGYQVDFSNVGDQPVEFVWITDTLPELTSWDGSWNMGFDWNRLISQDLTSTRLRWQFSVINPGENGWLQYNANLDDPNTRLRWYTNTVEISLDPADSNPADNVATTSAVLGEVERVELYVSPDCYGLWGEAQPGVPVTVTTSTGQYSTYQDGSCDGCWRNDTMPHLEPGDVITVTAGAGLMPVVITAPDPFTVHADASTDTIWGQIDDLNHQSLQIDLFGITGRSIQTDGSGNFSSTFSAIQPAAHGQVSYQTTINYASVRFNYRFQFDDLLLRINYGHDWLQALYPTGHTVWITVTNSIGEEKATYQGVTFEGAAWGDTGFETSGGGWVPNQPNIEEGDWVFARTDGGKTAQVHVGVIAGDLDLLADRISGTITAPFTTTLRLTCELWLENAPPGIAQFVDPAGGNFTCDWLGIYDLQPDMNVAVSYFEPGGHRIINVFWYGRPSVYIAKWADGQPGEEGVFIFHINYQNQGYDVAGNVLITDTLPAGMTFLSDTAPYTRISDDPLVWDVGALTAGSGYFDVYVHVDAAAGTVMTNTAQIYTSTPWDTAPPENKISIWYGTVQPNDTHLNISLGAEVGDPPPGSQYYYIYTVCNTGSTASSEVVLTATLPISLTFTGWTGGGWFEDSLAAHELVLHQPSIAANTCVTTYPEVQLDANTPIGYQLQVSGTITATTDMETSDNQAIYEHTVWYPHIDQWIYKYHMWGPVVPGSTLQFGIQYWYDANFSPGMLTITDTLPVSTTFVEAWFNGPSGPEFLTPSASGINYVVFELTGMSANVYGGEFYVRLLVDETASVGTQLINIAQVKPHALETNLDNNLSTWNSELLVHNADLELTSAGSWDLPNNKSNQWINIHNLGDLDSGQVTLLVSYPVSMTLAGSFTADEHLDNWQDYPNQHYFTATLTNIEAQGTASISYDTQMQLGGPVPRGQIFPFETSVTVPSGDINPDNNHVSFGLTSGPDLYVYKTLLSDPLVPGGIIYYHLQIGDFAYTSSWPRQSSALITDTLPAGLSYIWSSDTPDLVDGQTIVWNINYWYPGWDGWINLAAMITDTARGGDIFTNTVVMAASDPAEVDINPADNVSSQAFMIPLAVAPSDLVATAISCNQIDLSWSDNSADETNFHIERSDNGNTNWIEIAVISDATTYSDVPLPTAITFYYRVRAYRSSDDTFSDYSSTASATTQSCDVALVMDPPASMVGQGQTFDLLVEVHAGAQLVDGAAAYLNFDPAYLQVVSITPGGTLPLVLQNSYDNNAGQVDLVAGILPPDPFPSGTFTLMTVTFSAVADIPSTPIQFNDLGLRMSDITFGGYSILSGVVESTVEIINSARVRGSVTLQGRPTPPNTRWSVPLTVDLCSPGETTPLYSFNPTTDASGVFTLTEVVTGTYDMLVKNSHTLQNLKSVTLLPGPNIFNLGTLKEGDANNNNVINLNDFSILATTFAKCQGYSGYDDRADFNEDACINMNDFSLLSLNFAQEGPIITSIPVNPITVPHPTQEEVLIVVVPDQVNVNPGDTFSVVIQVQSGSLLMDGAQASLAFDPTKLQVISLTGNPSVFPLVVLNRYDNTSGTIDYAAGTFSDFPSGNVNLVTILFEAVGAVQSSPLTFLYGPLGTNVTFEGSTILTGDVDGEFQIGYFNKLSPAHGATLVPISPTLSWSGSLGATSYEYCYDDTDDDACDNWTSTLTETSVLLSELSYDTTYYWHVRAINTFGNLYTDDGETDFWSFTTADVTPVDLVGLSAKTLSYGIQIAWQTAQEIDLLGFNLFRAETLVGLRLKLNSQVIPAKNPGGLVGSEYEYLDATVETNQTYYYWIEWVGDRRSTLYGPVIARLNPFMIWLPLGMR